MDLYNHIREEKVTIINGFKSAGVTEAIQSAQEIRSVSKVFVSQACFTVFTYITLMQGQFVQCTAEQFIKRSNSSLLRTDTLEQYILYFELIIKPLNYIVFLLSFLQSIVFIRRHYIQ